MSACLELPDPGPCTGTSPRWYYLARERECYQFPWGGCAGNNNNFSSRQLCLATCRPSPACSLQPEAGPCRDRISRYYFDGQECQL